MYALSSKCRLLWTPDTRRGCVLLFFPHPLPFQIFLCHFQIFWWWGKEESLGGKGHILSWVFLLLGPHLCVTLRKLPALWAAGGYPTTGSPGHNCLGCGVAAGAPSLCIGDPLLASSPLSPAQLVPLMVKPVASPWHSQSWWSPMLGTDFWSHTSPKTLFSFSLQNGRSTL